MTTTLTVHPGAASAPVTYELAEHLAMPVPQLVGHFTLLGSALALQGKSWEELPLVPAALVDRWAMAADGYGLRDRLTPERLAELATVFQLTEQDTGAGLTDMDAVRREQARVRQQRHRASRAGVTRPGHAARHADPAQLEVLAPVGDGSPVTPAVTQVDGVAGTPAEAAKVSPHTPHPKSSQQVATHKTGTDPSPRPPYNPPLPPPHGAAVTGTGLVPAAAEPTALAKSGRAVPGRAAVEVRARVAAVLGELAETQGKGLKADELRQLQGEMAWLYWQHLYGHHRAQLDPKRLKVAMKRLVENSGNLDEILYALQGARGDDYVMATGKYAAQEAHDDFEFILRDRSAVERHAKRMKGWRDGLPHPKTEALRKAVTEGVEVAELPPVPAPGTLKLPGEEGYADAEAGAA